MLVTSAAAVDGTLASVRGHAVGVVVLQEGQEGHLRAECGLLPADVRLLFLAAATAAAGSTRTANVAGTGSTRTADVAVAGSTPDVAVAGSTPDVAVAGTTRTTCVAGDASTMRGQERLQVVRQEARQVQQEPDLGQVRAVVWRVRRLATSSAATGMQGQEGLQVVQQEGEECKEAQQALREQQGEQVPGDMRILLRYQETARVEYPNPLQTSEFGIRATRRRAACAGTIRPRPQTGGRRAPAAGRS